VVSVILASAGLLLQHSFHL